MQLAPIIVFVYNRADCTLKTLKHLKDNELADQSRLFIYSDGPKKGAAIEEINKINKVREIIRSEQWCADVKIIESEVNNGLAKSIIKGVSEIIAQYGKVIVLEDDLISSKHFLKYVNEGLNMYQDDAKVFQVVGYNQPVKQQFNNESFFLPFGDTLGWGTWERAWKLFDENPVDYKSLKTNAKSRFEFDLQGSYPFSEMLIIQMEEGLDSWGIRWLWSIFKHAGVCLYPDRTLVAHIGFDPDATHTKENIEDFNKYWNINYHIEKFPVNISVDMKHYKKIKKYFKGITGTSTLKRIVNKIYKFRNFINYFNKT